MEGVVHGLEVGLEDLGLFVGDGGFGGGGFMGGGFVDLVDYLVDGSGLHCGRD